MQKYFYRNYYDKQTNRKDIEVSKQVAIMWDVYLQILLSKFESLSFVGVFVFSILHQVAGTLPVNLKDNIVIAYEL